MWRKGTKEKLERGKRGASLGGTKRVPRERLPHSPPTVDAMAKAARPVQK